LNKQREEAREVFIEQVSKEKASIGIVLLPWFSG
jgi:hypothetical protein